MISTGGGCEEGFWLLGMSVRVFGRVLTVVVVKDKSEMIHVHVYFYTFFIHKVPKVLTYVPYHFRRVGCEIGL